MIILAKVFVILLALYLELAILEVVGEVVLGPSHGAMVDTKYRHAERLAAYKEYFHHPSPDTQAAFQAEMRLMHAHEDWKWEIPLASLIIANAIGFYFYFRRIPK